MRRPNFAQFLPSGRKTRLALTIVGGALLGVALLAVLMRHYAAGHALILAFIGLLAWPNLHACRQVVGNPDATFEDVVRHPDVIACL